MSNLHKIDHIVVLMMENRSFDNVLGWLYPDNADYRGVNGSMSNLDTCGHPHPVVQGTDPTAPFPDPHEPYEFVYQQMFNEPPDMPVPMMTGVTPPMTGFVVDYEDALAVAKKEAEHHHKPISKTEPGVIMNCFAPEQLPVINGLAAAYAVCDNWYCSVPTETFPNRSFMHAATSSGNVYNHWKDWFGLPEVFINDTKTIFNLLEENHVPWKVYHAGPIFACNALICQEKMYEFVLTDHFSSFDNFAVDAAEGNLPAYTFIEPNFICSSLYGPETDMHPAYGVFDTGAPTDVRYGDNFILDVYTSLRNSPNWEKTLFIITFDEHGGTFDHYPVEPSPNAVSPDGKVIKYKKGHGGGSDFDFSRFGVRVPAVLVSPWIEAGTICHTQFDHTSVIKTISEKWLGGQNLTARDALANDVGEVLSLETARTDTPHITPDTPPAFQDCSNQSLSPLQYALMLAAARLISLKTKKLVNVDELDTKEKAVNTLESVWRDFVERGNI